MGKKIKNEKGFTLLEVIISIAAVAFMSGFILQMFILSNDVNERAKDLDRANLISMSAIETFKGGNAPEDFLTSEFISNGEIKEGDSETNVYLCYDEDWNNIDPPEGVELFPDGNLSGGAASSVKFLLRVKLEPVELGGFEAFEASAKRIGLDDGEGVGRFYKITTWFLNCKKPSGELDMMSLSASKYFAR